MVIPQKTMPVTRVPEFKLLNEIPRGEGETILAYGNSGSGKTWFCGTAGDRVLFINIGSGIRTLQSPLFKEKVNGNPLVATINETLGDHGLAETATLFDAVSDTIDHALTNFPDKFDTVVVDDASALRRGAMNKGLEVSDAMNRSRTLKDVKSKHDMVIPAIQDYGVEMNLIEQFIGGYTSILKEAGKHFILTAHTREVYKKGDKIGDLPVLHSVRPGFTGQTFPDQVPAYFDNVLYFECVGAGDNTVYRVRTSGSESLIAKTRNAGVFKTTETNLNFLDFIRRVRETETPIIGKK